MNIQLIKDSDPEAEKLMQVLTFFESSTCIPKIFINGGEPELEDKNLASALSDEFRVNDMLLKLTSGSLFKEAPDNSIRIHPLVQEVILKNLISVVLSPPLNMGNFPINDSPPPR